MFSFEGGYCFVFAIGTLIALSICHLSENWDYWKACNRTNFCFGPPVLIGLFVAVCRHDVLFFLIPIGCAALGIASVMIRGSLCDEEHHEEMPTLGTTDEDSYEEVF